MGTAATPQVVDQRRSARSYGLGGIEAAPARLHGRTEGNEPQIRPLCSKTPGEANPSRSRGSINPHRWSSQPAGVDKAGQGVRALAPFLFRLSPTPGRRHLLAVGRPQLRVAASASSWA